MRVRRAQIKKRRLKPTDARRNQSLGRDDLFFAAGVKLGMSFRSLLLVIPGVRAMAIRHLRVMSGLLDRSRFVGAWRLRDGAARLSHDALQPWCDVLQS